MKAKNYLKKVTVGTYFLGRPLIRWMVCFEDRSNMASLPLCLADVIFLSSSGRLTAPRRDQWIDFV